jgi:PilZ domain
VTTAVKSARGSVETEERMSPYHTIEVGEVGEVNAADRRRHPRKAVGLPVRVHFAGGVQSVTVELRDVSPGGCYFSGAVPRSSKFAFGFRMPGGQVCLAAGQVLRVDRAGFAAILSRSTEAFDGFVERLSGRQ